MIYLIFNLGSAIDNILRFILCKRSAKCHRFLTGFVSFQIRRRYSHYIVGTICCYFSNPRCSCSRSIFTVIHIINPKCYCTSVLYIYCFDLQSLFHCTEIKTPMIKNIACSVRNFRLNCGLSFFYILSFRDNNFFPSIHVIEGYRVKNTLRCLNHCIL